MLIFSVNRCMNYIESVQSVGVVRKHHFEQPKCSSYTVKDEQ